MARDTAGVRHVHYAERCKEDEILLDEEEDEPVGLSQEALDAHRQVLEMAATIEILTRDFEKQQKELLEAYKRLQEYSLQDRLRDDGDPSGARPSIRDGKFSRSRNNEHFEWNHEAELEEARRLVSIKDIALTEALEQRNEYKMQLDKAEALIRELRSAHVDTLRHHASKQMTPSMGLAPNVASVPPSVLGTGVAELPRNERFDEESSYHRRENDDLFWRKQYKEAVRMRKQYAQPAPGQQSHSARGPPSLKIFSRPNNQRRKGITDESVPFSRYIGISARQNEIIKEQHRMLS
ncbi:TPA: hypothetical protein N0F65_008055 [Lagenidium giganteum]|uniref:Uncharacterized protein n=1 Tax=Lagenidium giganteum TaxID=4803 RepID=A0AAV2YT07_9STRA|nr:TPA: hypothetical protein N0F65_008055 [Lagenidium giganteum]